MKSNTLFDMSYRIYLVLYFYLYLMNTFLFVEMNGTNIQSNKTKVSHQKKKKTTVNCHPHFNVKKL